jgi:hypothetical protein
MRFRAVLFPLVLWVNSSPAAYSSQVVPTAGVHGDLSTLDEILRGPDLFTQAAVRSSMSNRVTDKVSACGGSYCHNYEVMYGMFLYPLKERVKRLSRKIRMLEIGLGCGQPYGPTASIKTWRKVFKNELLDLWVAEMNEECLRKHESRLQGVHVLIGDQSNETTLRDWIRVSRGRFDVIVDDGGHRSNQILISLAHLWDSLIAGGLYFIEDLHVQSTDKYYMSPGFPPPISVIQLWIEALAVRGAENIADESKRAMLRRFPLPAQLQWVFCQQEACVLGKAPPL